MSGDRTADVARLADMLVRCGIERGRLGHLDADNLARVLMPTVEAIADERAAEALMWAAAEVRDNHGTASLSAKRIDIRAAAVRGRP